MSQVAILLWLPAVAAGDTGDAVGAVPTSEPRALTSAPSPAERALLNRWAERRLLVLEEPHPVPASSYPGYSSELVGRIEDLLEQARTLSGSLDEARALEQLLHAEKIVYAHPELPQAGFLLAEAAAQRADLERRRGNESEARVQERRARVLEGRRVSTYTQAEPAAQEDAAPEATLTRVEGLAPTDVLEWNGRRQPSPAAMASSGEHHVRVLRFGELVFSGFVALPAGAVEIRLVVPPPKPCSLADFATVSSDGRSVSGQRAVRCPRWVAARAGEPSSIEVALCDEDRCGKFLTWQPGDGTQLSAPLYPTPGWRWPVWATYLGLGIGVAATTGAVLWQSGAFDPAERGPVTWTFGGIDE